jgi:hypothetical protein
MDRVQYLEFSKYCTLPNVILVLHHTDQPWKFKIRVPDLDLNSRWGAMGAVFGKFQILHPILIFHDGTRDPGFPY